MLKRNFFFTPHPIASRINRSLVPLLNRYSHSFGGAVSEVQLTGASWGSSVCSTQATRAMGDAEAVEGLGATGTLQTLCARWAEGNDEGELVRALQELLDAGADPNEVDSFERAPLSLLCMNNPAGPFVDAAKLLLTAGASPSSPDAWGRTSLHWCCDRGWLAVAELLLARGAPVNACTKQGDTPLLWAAKAGHVKLVELLLKSGSDPLLRNNRDEAALDVAVDEVVRTLISSACEKVSTSTGVVQDEQEPSVQDLKEKAPVEPSETKTELGSRALAGLPMGGQVGTSGGPLFSAYKKQPMSSSAGSGSGPGPKKMKITLKKK